MTRINQNIKQHFVLRYHYWFIFVRFRRKRQISRMLTFFLSVLQRNSGLVPPLSKVCLI